MSVVLVWIYVYFVYVKKLYQVNVFRSVPLQR
jgi:hypothetical protein